jgi:hypothetical protein
MCPLQSVLLRTIGSTNALCEPELKVSAPTAPMLVYTAYGIIMSSPALLLRACV